MSLNDKYEVFDALGGIDEKYIREADEQIERHRMTEREVIRLASDTAPLRFSWKKLIVSAACLAAVICAAAFAVSAIESRRQITPPNGVSYTTDQIRYLSRVKKKWNSSANVIFARDRLNYSEVTLPESIDGYTLDYSEGIAIDETRVLARLVKDGYDEGCGIYDIKNNTLTALDLSDNESNVSIVTSHDHYAHSAGANNLTKPLYADSSYVVLLETFETPEGGSNHRTSTDRLLVYDLHDNDEGGLLGIAAEYDSGSSTYKVLNGVRDLAVLNDVVYFDVERTYDKTRALYSLDIKTNKTTVMVEGGYNASAFRGSIVYMTDPFKFKMLDDSTPPLITNDSNYLWEILFCGNNAFKYTNGLPSSDLSRSAAHELTSVTTGERIFSKSGGFIVRFSYNEKYISVFENEEKTDGFIYDIKNNELLVFDKDEQTLIPSWSYTGYGFCQKDGAAYIVSAKPDSAEIAKHKYIGEFKELFNISSDVAFVRDRLDFTQVELPTDYNGYFVNYTDAIALDSDRILAQAKKDDPRALYVLHKYLIYNISTGEFTELDPFDGSDRYNCSLLYADADYVMINYWSSYTENLAPDTLYLFDLNSMEERLVYTCENDMYDINSFSNAALLNDKFYFSVNLRWEEEYEGHKYFEYKEDLYSYDIITNNTELVRTGGSYPEVFDGDLIYLLRDDPQSSYLTYYDTLKFESLSGETVAVIDYSSDPESKEEPQRWHRGCIFGNSSIFEIKSNSTDYSGGNVVFSDNTNGRTLLFSNRELGIRSYNKDHITFGNEYIEKYPYFLYDMNGDEFLLFGENEKPFSVRWSLGGCGFVFDETIKSGDGYVTRAYIVTAKKEPEKTDIPVTHPVSVLPEEKRLNSVRVELPARYDGREVRYPGTVLDQNRIMFTLHENGACLGYGVYHIDTNTFNLISDTENKNPIVIGASSDYAVLLEGESRLRVLDLASEKETAAYDLKEDRFVIGETYAAIFEDKVYVNVRTPSGETQLCCFDAKSDIVDKLPISCEKPLVYNDQGIVYSQTSDVLRSIITLYGYTELETGLSDKLLLGKNNRNYKIESGKTYNEYGSARTLKALIDLYNGNVLYSFADKASSPSVYEMVTDERFVSVGEYVFDTERIEFLESGARNIQWSGTGFGIRRHGTEGGSTAAEIVWAKTLNEVIAIENGIDNSKPLTNEDKELQAMIKELLPAAEEVNSWFCTLYGIGTKRYKTGPVVNDDAYYPIPENFKKYGGSITVPRTAEGMREELSKYFTESAVEEYMKLVSSGTVSQNEDGYYSFITDKTNNSGSPILFIETDGEMFRLDRAVGSTHIDPDTVRLISKSADKIEFTYIGYAIRSDLMEHPELCFSGHGAIIHENGAWKLNCCKFVFPGEEALVNKRLAKYLRFDAPTSFTSEDKELQAILDELFDRGAGSIYSWFVGGFYYGENVKLRLPGNEHAYKYPVTPINYTDESGMKVPTTIREMRELLSEFFTEESVERFMEWFGTATMTPNGDGSYNVVYDDDDPQKYQPFLEIDGRLYFTGGQRGGGLGFDTSTAKITRKTPTEIEFIYIDSVYGGDYMEYPEYFGTARGIIKYENGGWKMNVNMRDGFVLD